MNIAAGEGEAEAVRIALSNLETDLKKVLGEIRIRHLSRAEGEQRPAIVVRTLPVGERAEESGADALSASLKLLKGADGAYRKEAFLLKVLDGVLYILGTDRRGTIYGIYTFCEWMGVSPWYFWADVPVKKKEAFFLPDGYEKADYPSVEYRGIFINDEEELEAWVKRHMGEDTIGVKTYEKIFELLLRLKGNYIWPAMHVNSFNAVPENGALADRMGIVVGTSHCDMLMRSNNREWRPWIARKGYYDAVYDYSLEGRNRRILQEYWRESVEQNRDFEVCYTLGMRGIHDSGFEVRSLAGMTGEELRRAKIALLERIIRDQKQILEETLGRETLMTFIPYKEVLELYDNGLEVPEELTLVWANDNYGYIRRYPSEKEKKRKGGNGIYYHNSYWAPPSMSYVFLCSIPLAHTGNELRKAYAEGIRKLWVLNCGAMKPLEMEIEFFLRLGWEIGKEDELTADVDAYVADWIDRNFSGGNPGGEPGSGGPVSDGSESSSYGSGGYGSSSYGSSGPGGCGRDMRGARSGFGAECARLLNDFSQLTNVRKLENMDSDAFSQTAYGDEAAVRIHRYEELFAKGNRLYERLPEEEKDAFFQLVLMRIHAAYFTNLQYYYGDRSTLSCERGNLQAAAEYVRRTRLFEDARTAMLRFYNKTMAGGKWDGILDPEGFPPPRAAMMPVCTPPLSISGEPGLHVEVWNGKSGITFSGPSVKWIEIGNTGEGWLKVEVRFPLWLRSVEETDPDCTGFHPYRSDEGWVLTEDVRTEKRMCFAPADGCQDQEGEIRIRCLTDGSEKCVPVKLCAWERQDVSAAHDEGNRGTRAESSSSAHCGMDSAVQDEDGLVVLEADCASSADFRIVRRLGRGWGNLAEARKECVGEPLAYHFRLRREGSFWLELDRFPSLNSTGRLRIGLAVDGGERKVLESESTDEWRGTWRLNVLNNVDRLWGKLPWLSAGPHRLELYAIDPYFAFSRILIYTEAYQKNNLAGIGRCKVLPDPSGDVVREGEQALSAGAGQALPKHWDVRAWCLDFYGTFEQKPHPRFYAPERDDSDNLTVTARICGEGESEERTEPAQYLLQGRSIFAEQDGRIRIDAAAALAESCFAWTQGDWRHCQSESHDRCGIALYVKGDTMRVVCPEELLRTGAEETGGQRGLLRQPGRPMTDNGGVPSLQYRLKVCGGFYTLWMLSKFNTKEQSYYGIAVDGQELKKEDLYGKGCLWRYEAEQIYRWVPAAVLELEKGEHLLQILSVSDGMRYDRFCLTGNSCKHDFPSNQAAG